MLLYLYDYNLLFLCMFFDSFQVVTLYFMRVTGDR